MKTQVEMILETLEYDIDFHLVMEDANDNPTYGYYASRLQEILDILKTDLKEGN
jgi:DNA-binding FadR family transcriptional regulator